MNKSCWWRPYSLNYHRQRYDVNLGLSEIRFEVGQIELFNSQIYVQDGFFFFFGAYLKPLIVLIIHSVFF